MIFNINLMLRARMKYFNLTKRAQFYVKKNLFFSLFFFLELYLKTFGLQFKYIELVPFNEEAQTEFDEEEFNAEAKTAAFKIFQKKKKNLMPKRKPLHLKYFKKKLKFQILTQGPLNWLFYKMQRIKLICHFVLTEHLESN